MVGQLFVLDFPTVVDKMLVLWFCLAGFVGTALASPSGGVSKRSTVGDILKDIEGAITCAGCEVS